MDVSYIPIAKARGFTTHSDKNMLIITHLLLPEALNDKHNLVKLYYDELYRNE